MEKKYLVLFDFDGTLFDTMEVNYHAYRDALAAFGIPLDKEYFAARCYSRHYKEFLPAIMGGSGRMEEVHEAKKAAYISNLDKARINAHLFEMILSMRPAYHIAIVTTASRKNVMEVLSYFKVEYLFEHIVAQEDIVRPKPDPQGFEMAMGHFGAPPERTLIFEDSEVGVQAAEATGAAVMVVKRF